MQHSSETVAALATPLAKAQVDLVNPEKSLVGTVYSDRRDETQSFRYASLSSAGSTSSERPWDAMRLR